MSGAWAIEDPDQPDDPDKCFLYCVEIRGHDWSTSTISITAKTVVAWRRIPKGPLLLAWIPKGHDFGGYPKALVL